MGVFGDKFRKAREGKELSLDDVSAVTKISARMLRAIEEENFDQLPGGVFNKGFIRAYAKHLGLDPEEAINDYLACLRQAQINAQQTWEPPGSVPAPKATKTVVNTPKEPPAKPPASDQLEEIRDLQLPRPEDVPPRPKFRRSPARPTPLGVVAAIAIVLAVIFWTRHSHHAPSETPQPTVKASGEQTAPGTTGNSSSDSRAQNGPAVPSSSPSSNPAQSGESPASAGSPVPSPADDASQKNDVTVRTFGKTNVASPQKTSPSLTLVIRATENSWISVLADGEMVTQENLIAPAHTSVRANREVIVKVGNAAGVSFLFNGKEISPQGNESEVKTLVFTASGVQSLSGQNAATAN